MSGAAGPAGRPGFGSALGAALAPWATSYREARVRWHQRLHGLHTLAKVGVAVSFAGLIALLSQLSFPVPWTPVPLTLQVLGVYLAGSYLGPRYAAVSLAIYLGAGAAGFHVFAPSPAGSPSYAYNPDGLYAGNRWRILVPDAVRHTGSSAGYLLGFLPAAAFVGAWLRRPAADRRLLWVAATALAALLLLSALGSLFLAQGGTFASTGSGPSYTASFDLLVVFVGAAAILLPTVAWLLTRTRQRAEAIRHYVVLLGATAIIHLCGVVVLKLVLGWGWAKAAALGSTVFLPFDALKAGLAVALSLPFLPPVPEATQ